MKSRILLPLILIVGITSSVRNIIPADVGIAAEDISSFPQFTQVHSYDKETNTIGVQNSEGKTGFVDDKGKVVIPFMYDLYTAASFSEGLAEVKLNKKSGYINIKNEVVIPFSYDMGSDFNNGIASVVKNGKYGIIDNLGNTVVPFEYDTITSFDSGFYIVKDNKYGILNKKGEIITSPIYDLFKKSSLTVSTDKYLIAKKDGKYGVIDYSGNILIPFYYDNIDVGDDSSVITEKNGKYAVVNLLEEEIIPYSEEPFTALGCGFFTKGGLLNSTGTVLYNSKGDMLTKKGEYSFVMAYQDGYIMATQNSKMGLLDFNGNEISDFSYDYMQMIAKDTFKIKKGNKWGILKNQKEKMFNFELTDVLFIDNNNNIGAKNENKGLIYIISPDFKITRCFQGINLAYINDSYIVQTDYFAYSLIPN